MLRLKYFCLIVWIVVAGCSRQDTVRQISLEDFFTDPVKTSYLISPDGKHISYLQSYKSKLNIFIQSADGKKVSRITNEIDRDVSYYFWANNNELIYLKDKTNSDRVHLWVVSKDGKTSREVLSEDNIRLKFINPTRIWNDELLISLNKRDSTVFDAYRLNIRDNKLVLAVQNPGNITNWYTDQEGKLRMAISSDGTNETLLYRDSESDAFRPVITNNFKTLLAPISFSGDNKETIYALSNQGRDKTALIEFDCKKGREKREIFSSAVADVIDGVHSVRRKTLLYAIYETWKKQRYYLDAEKKAVFADLEKKFPDTELTIVDRDSSLKKFIVKTYTDKTPGAHYLYTLSDHKIVKLSDINPLLKEDEMCEMKPISYKSRDGLEINGYLTIPKGTNGLDLPVVVLPHGGPSSRVSWEFNPEVQFLANRGYAVFQMNFRGSTGYGKEFWTAGFKKWGTDMQNDITDGVKWLIDENIADPERIAIYGSSFGGYSALHGLCFQPKLYACGASYSGLTNLFTYMKSTPPYVKPSLEMYYEMVGDPERDADYFRAVSPVFHTDKIQVPVLIAQGGKDPRINVNGTNQFVKELKKRQVPVSYLLKDEERHTFKNQANRREFYRKLEELLTNNIGNN
jgi:dipeptidyl aminopeptidase/acylaminoacyl peptidase